MACTVPGLLHPVMAQCEMSPGAGAEYVVYRCYLRTFRKWGWNG